MPHSSGGGSSSGGSHSSGGGYHSSGGGHSSSSAPRPRVYDSYAPGRHVFVRYVDDRPVFRYGNYSYDSMRSRKGSVARLVFAIILCVVVFVLPGVLLIADAVSAPARLTTGEQACEVVDEVDAFTDAEEADIQKAARRYYDMTGIPIVIHTISQETFEAADKTDLSTYAYYDYVRRFTDEDHWLLVFEDIDRSNQRWAFEAMQGDDTDGWLTEDVTSQFNDDLTSALWRADGGTYGEAFATAIDELADRGHPTDWESLGAGIVLLGIAAITIGTEAHHTAADTKMSKDLDGFHEVKVAPAEAARGPRLVTCEWCGGTYVFGETECPHCGAPGRTTEP